MGVLLDLLANNALEKIDSRRFVKTSYGIEKSMRSVENYALYKYAMQKAQRYPRKWISNHLSAKVLVRLSIDKDIQIKSLNIINKSESLQDEEIVYEVIKTLKLARNKFPPSQYPVIIDIPLNWL